MDYEAKIRELTERIERLEKYENRRILKKKIKIAWSVTKVVIIIVILLSSYFYVYKKVIKPYKDKVDYVEEKVDSVESFVKEKWESIKKYTSFLQ